MQQQNTDHRRFFSSKRSKNLRPKTTKAGDPIFASTFKVNFGAHAEYKCLPEEGAVVTTADNMTDEEAATLSIGANTALFFLKKGNIQPGKKVLINGALRVV